MIYTVLHILFFVVFAWLTIDILYLLFVSIAAYFYRAKGDHRSAEKKNIAILIPSYREDDVIVNTVSLACSNNYPEQHFDVFVAADRLQPSTIDRLKKTRAHIFEVDFTTGSKARSLNYLLNKIDESKYDIALVLDGDNVMKPDFLDQINTAFQRGHKVVQAHRMAKNLNTSVAVLDAISEEINNHFFRKAQSALGLSSSLIGSGMAFPFRLLKQVYNKPGILDNPACDREVDFEMLKANARIIYLDHAHLLDEKVASKNVFENQRRRWMESQLMHISLFFSRREKVNRKNADYWNKLFINLIPPRSLVLSLFFFIFCLSIVEYLTQINITGISWQLWLLLFLIYIISMLLAVPAKFFSMRTAKAFFYLPAILFSFIKAAVTVRANRKEFVHTPKTFTGNSASTEKPE